ncbi:hypothetical protein [Deinococcus roseus]|uniref:SAM-dependent methyltransferase n=1 Tax=Deinococcus roseus TaxID=392414 RepID=A0ABQ2D5M3_9DEIO|nr:hypothetical protein [Deinococcus roseus]GGJ44531.1 hypothetical protein GCM10008938_33410 [Deinococcus roseus]
MSQNSTPLFGKTSEPTPSTPLLQSDKQANKLEESALKMEPTILKLGIPAFAHQGLTRRRATMRANKQAECDRKKRVQAILRSMAQAARNGTLPLALSKIIRAKQVEDLLWRAGHLDRGADGLHRLYGHMTEETLNKLGITSPEALVQACTFISTCTLPDAEAASTRRLRELEFQLVGSQIPGFFPTPLPLIHHMLRHAEIEPGMHVLEPSAGKGDILEAIRTTQPAATLQAVEHNHTLAEILTLKGFPVQQGDFMEFRGEVFDRVVMNPPFEKHQDISHVQHAYSLLKAGGKLVSVMCEGSFFRNDQKSVAFRRWLSEVKAEVIKNPEGTFSTSDAFRRTGTNTRLVIIKHAM